MPLACELAVSDNRAHYRIPDREPHVKAMTAGEVEAQSTRGGVDTYIFSVRNAARERAETLDEAQCSTELAAPRA
jgi:hypothetical protein